MISEKSKNFAATSEAKEGPDRSRLDSLISLRGKIAIEYDWETTESEELRAAEEREKLER